MVDDAPQALVGGADKGGDRGHGHLSGQAHDHLLEKQGKAAAGPSPGDGDSTGAMVRAIDSRHPRGQIAVMLKEIEVPGELLVVMRLTHPAPLGTGMAGAPVGAKRQVELVRHLLGVEPLADDLPGRCQPQAKSEDAPCAHTAPSQGTATVSPRAGSIPRCASKIQIAGLPPGVTRHTVRATFITQALEKNCPIEAVKRSVGHSNISTTQMYDKRTMKHRESASFAVAYGCRLLMFTPFVARFF